MGIAVLAAGGSIPEATSGIINARNGKITLKHLCYERLSTDSHDCRFNHVKH